MGKIKLKTPEEIEVMREGGRKLSEIKNSLKNAVKPGVSAADIEAMAEDLISKSGGKSSFKMVPGYRWNTCINVNDGVVHGIPHKHIIFEKGDVVSIDVGLFYKGFHTDTSVSVGINLDKVRQDFLKVGKKALDSGIKAIKDGNYIYDISEAIEKVLLGNSVTPIKALVGHGVGRDLHEDPQIPCFTSGNRESTEKILVGSVLAVEIMYSEGGEDIYIDGSDEWTIRTKDGKIAALFEETVALRADGRIVLTDYGKN